MASLFEGAKGRRLEGGELQLVADLSAEERGLFLAHFEDQAPVQGKVAWFETRHFGERNEPERGGVFGLDTHNQRKDNAGQP